jgi:hypothetical protein
VASTRKAKQKAGKPAKVAASNTNRQHKAAACRSTDAPKKATDAAVPVDRRGGGDRRTSEERRKRNVSVAIERRVVERRAKVARRRQIDPTTCERDYSADEIEFMSAMDEYKRCSGRMFPTCSEVLEVIRKLGYEKRTPARSPAPPRHSSDHSSAGS